MDLFTNLKTEKINRSQQSHLVNYIWAHSNVSCIQVNKSNQWWAGLHVLAANIRFDSLGCIELTLPFILRRSESREKTVNPISLTNVSWSVIFTASAPASDTLTWSLHSDWQRVSWNKCQGPVAQNANLCLAFTHQDGPLTSIHLLIGCCGRVKPDQ